MKRAAGTALSVIVVLFDHHESLRNHRDTSTLEHYPILSRTISVMPRETLKHTARGSAHASEPKSRVSGTSLAGGGALLRTPELLGGGV